MMHHAVVDLGYGDGGKGILTARLAARYEPAWVIRYNGGCQAAHNVVTDDGRHHTFAQFGAGTFSGVKTFLSKYMLVEPFSLINEAEALSALGIKRPLSMVTIDPQALMTTPYHWELNQWEEDQRIGANARHGSTGRGIGMTTLFSIEDPDNAPRVGDIFSSTYTLRNKLWKLRKWCIERGCPEDRLPGSLDLTQRYQKIEPLLTIMPISWGRVLKQDNVIFEGAQGVLLDQDYGFHPYTTWSRTTDANIYAMLRDATALELADQIKTIGVTRAYMTRHGAGPFVTEQPDWMTLEAHNKTEHYQGGWRQGYVDYVALQYALDVCVNIDSLYVTHTDAQDRFLEQAATGYEHYVTGEPFKLDPHLCGREARPERQRQTEALLQCEPVLTSVEPSKAAESLSEALNLTLFGKGYGPKIGDGEFL